MGKRFSGTIDVDIRDSQPDWEPFMQPVAPAGSPNVLYIVLDDDHIKGMLDLTGLEDFVTVLSGTTDNVALLDGIREQVGDDPAAWLPLLRTAVRERRATPQRTSRKV